MNWRNLRDRHGPIKSGFGQRFRQYVLPGGVNVVVASGVLRSVS